MNMQQSFKHSRTTFQSNKMKWIHIKLALVELQWPKCKSRCQWEENNQECNSCSNIFLVNLLKIILKFESIITSFQNFCCPGAIGGHFWGKKISVPFFYSTATHTLAFGPCNGFTTSCSFACYCLRNLHLWLIWTFIYFIQFSL